MGKLYVYHIQIKDFTATCYSVREAVSIINDQIGLQVATKNNLSNFFTRPENASKRVFNQVVKVRREVGKPKNSKVMEVTAEKNAIIAELKAENAKKEALIAKLEVNMKKEARIAKMNAKKTQ
tara:strand:- start:1904 stop:2272 length:369 start_codon:yes stop_codon:yes gene_type:complete